MINQKSKYVFYIFLVIMLILVFEITYLKFSKSMSNNMLDKKVAFTKLSTLPDLALSSENIAIRHRSLATIFSIYGDDGSLREKALSTYVISYSHIINPHAKRLDDEE